MYEWNAALEISPPKMKFSRSFARAFLFRIVLAVERAISAERNHAEREQFSRFFAALFINRGTEAHGKFVDFKAERFAGEIVPEFVNGYHGEKNRHRRQHAARIL